MISSTGKMEKIRDILTVLKLAKELSFVLTGEELAATVDISKKYLQAELGMEEAESA